MAEKFSVDTNELAGLGAGTEDLAAYVGKVEAFVNAEAGPKDGWNGLMSQIKAPFEGMRTATANRYNQRQTVMYMTGNELISLANLYRDQEQRRSERIRQVSDTPVTAHDSYQQGDATTAAAHYTSDGQPDLTPPAHEEADVVGIVREAASWVADADDAIKWGTGWSPINDTFNKLVGNWAELTRIGNAYSKAGEGIAGAGEDFQTMANRVKSHWDGDAAKGFDGWAPKLAKAFQAEKPLTKVVKDCLDLLVAEIKKLIKKIVELIKKKLEEHVQIKSWSGALKALARRVPFAGNAYEAGEVIKMLYDVYNEAQKLVEEVQKAVDLVKSVVDFFSNPVDFLKDAGEKKLKDKLDEAEKKAGGGGSDEFRQLKKDLPAAFGGAFDVAQTPGGAYSGGKDGHPWADAQ